MHFSRFSVLHNCTGLALYKLQSSFYCIKKQPQSVVLYGCCGLFFFESQSHTFVGRKREENCDSADK
jgi:hypothetical protein